MLSYNALFLFSDWIFSYLEECKLQAIKDGEDGRIMQKVNGHDQLSRSRA